MSGIRIEGLEDTLKYFDEAPDKLLKLSQKASREGAKAVGKKLRSGLPKNFKKLTKYKVKKTGSGELSITIGLYNNQGRPEKAPDWFKAYWLNYGTLEGRDPSHHFSNAIKRRHTSAAKNRRNKEGIQARNFYEGAIRGWEDVFIRAFEEALKKNEDDLK